MKKIMKNMLIAALALLSIGAYAQKRDSVAPLPFTGGELAGFVFVPPGTFSMGGTVNSWEKPIHQVTISKGFYMSDHEVTQKE